MKVKIKKLHPDAVIPKYSIDGDAGLDLTATSKHCDKEGNIVYGTGLAFEIPKGYVGLLFPRSSNAKKDLILSNSVGVLDSNYRGEVLFKFKPIGIALGLNTRPNHHIVENPHLGSNYATKDRIGQLLIIPYPEIEFEEVEQLSDSERGNGGYGSTGN